MQDIKAILDKQREFYMRGATRSVEHRAASLRKMQAWIKSHENEIFAALKSDLNKAPFEAYATESGIILDEIKHTLKHIRSWSMDKPAISPLKQFPCKCFIRPEPYGVVLIMSPWNYPFQLTLAPLIGAVAAGNCAMVKPSAYSPHTSAVIGKLIREVVDEAHVAVIEGGRKENQALLGERFDYIFFTGSVSVGKTVMEAAAKNLTPITLELGGKSPCIVDHTANVALAAKRIAWGKFLNAGQTCVAPDYLLVHKSVKDKLINGIIKALKSFYGESAISSGEYAKMINEKHFARVLGLMEGEKLLCGGNSDSQTLQIEPTIIDGATWQSPVMQEEIFGPLLPVIEYDSLSEAVRQINARPKPLALYCFSNSKQNQEYILNNVSFGGGCINDTVVHLATSHMPFGGVGESGMGGYHGKASFETFSHKKSILKKSNLIDIPLRYPPYKNHLALLKKL